MPNRRSVFFVSTALALLPRRFRQPSLLTQFDGVIFARPPPFHSWILPKRSIAPSRRSTPAARPMASARSSSPIVNEQLSERMRDSDAFVLDFFQIFISPLEQETGRQAARTRQDVRTGCAIRANISPVSKRSTTCWRTTTVRASRSLIAPSHFWSASRCGKDTDVAVSRPAMRHLAPTSR